MGPALADRLLLEFGSVERVVTADAEQLMRVRGVGRQKAERIRELVGDALGSALAVRVREVMLSKTVETRARTTKDGRLN